MITEIVDYGNKTVWEIIAEKLNEADIEVYPPATHIGLCKKPYVVLKQDGSIAYTYISSMQVQYMVMLYVPKDRYEYLTVYENKIKRILDDLYPMIVYTSESNTDYYDDNYDAHMRYFIYRNNVKNRH